MQKEKIIVPNVVQLNLLVATERQQKELISFYKRYSGITFKHKIGGVKLNEKK